MVEVDRDEADASGEPDPVSVGLDGEAFGRVVAVEGQGVRPAWPSTVSLPSPGFQVKRSSPAAAVHDVGARVALDRVTPVVALDCVHAAAALQDVVAP